jgi:hypothetical protein
VGGKNYLVPVDAKLEDEADLASETVTLESFTGALEAEERTSLIFLDACRDNPLGQRASRGLGVSRSGAVRSGLAEVNAGAGTLIAYATQPGAVAADGEGRHSPFAEALLRHMPSRGLEVRQLMMRVRNDVLAATSRRQNPWEESALTAEFYFHPGPPASPRPPCGPAGRRPRGGALARDRREQARRRLRALPGELPRGRVLEPGAGQDGGADAGDGVADPAGRGRRRRRRRARGGPGARPFVPAAARDLH